MHFDHDPSFVQPFRSFTQQSCTLNKVQRLTDRDVFEVTWFWKMMTQVPIYQCGQGLAVTRNVWGGFRYLLASITLRTDYQHQLEDFQLTVSCYQPCQYTLLSDQFLSFFTSLCPNMDCQRSSCFLLVQSLITHPWQPLQI
jgi:hypothetical protein